MLAVHVHVLDAATKRPTPVRIRISDGKLDYVPFGQYAEFSGARGEVNGGHLRFGTQRWFHIDGRCEVKLPANVSLTVEATKGPEWTPVKQTVTLGPGQISVRLAIEKWSKLDGWRSGDSRCHFLTLHEAMLEAEAEGVGVVNLLAVEHRKLGMDGNTYLESRNLTAFSGQVAACNNVYVNSLNVHPYLGSLALLNCHRPVFPLAFGDENDDWSLMDWCRQCHRKKGLAVWVDGMGEALLAAILGEVDAFELSTPARLSLAYRLWNTGIHIPLVGGSGKDSTLVPLGAMRTYASVKDDSYATWIEAVRAGNAFVTNGPLLTFDGSRATAESVVPFETLEIVADGDAIATAKAVTGERWTATCETTMPAETGWAAARVMGATGSILYPSTAVFAHSSPLFLNAKPQLRAMSLLAAEIDRVREWATERGRFSEEKWQHQLLANCDAGAKYFSS